MKKLPVNKLNVLVLGLTVAVVALGTLLPESRGQQVLDQVLGAFPSHLTREEYDISVGVSGSGLAFGEKRRSEVRETIVVPRHYGVLVTITEDQNRSILWFQGEDGVLRNVIVGNAGASLYRIEQNASQLKEVERGPF